jgi:hypothetical protein
MNCILPDLRTRVCDIAHRSMIAVSDGERYQVLRATGGKRQGWHGETPDWLRGQHSLP